MSSINIDKIIDTYRKLGLETRVIDDEPGFVHEAHRHSGVRLYTLSGSAGVKLDNKEWLEVKTGDEIIIKDDQLHEAVAGDKGWVYIFAASSEEMMSQGI